jgi:hypothetical protein
MSARPPASGAFADAKGLAAQAEQRADDHLLVVQLGNPYAAQVVVARLVASSIRDLGHVGYRRVISDLDSRRGWARRSTDRSTQELQTETEAVLL